MEELLGLPPCRVCGGIAFEHVNVLWGGLISQWGLTEDEAKYVNVQQGSRCKLCGSNVRSIALAEAILRYFESTATLREWVTSPLGKNLRLLEINEAGALSSVLQSAPGHRLVRYPDYDMMALGLNSGSFDAVIHSDTVEHVADPLQGLKECRRVLRQGGACFFTVPIILGRLTRSRHGLPPSLHGNESCVDKSLMVHTEFGADVWCRIFEAGFRECRIVTYCYPAGIALIAIA